MDKLEGSVPHWKVEHTTHMLQELEQFSSGFFDRLESTSQRLQENRFQARDQKLKVQQNFLTLLAVADSQFMEHVSQRQTERFQQKPKLRMRNPQQGKKLKK